MLLENTIYAAQGNLSMQITTSNSKLIEPIFYL